MELHGRRGMRGFPERYAADAKWRVTGRKERAARLKREGDGIETERAAGSGGLCRARDIAPRAASASPPFWICSGGISAPVYC